MDLHLRDLRALVGGGSSGLGAAIATVLADEGAAVGIAAHASDRLDAQARSIAAVPIPADLEATVLGLLTKSLTERIASAKQVLELLVVEPREAAERADEYLVLLRVDREGGVGRREERELEEAAIERLASGERDRHDGGQEQKNPVVLEDVDTDARGALSELRVPLLVQRIELRSARPSSTTASM
jgi:hypothetical protein